MNILGKRIQCDYGDFYYNNCKYFIEYINKADWDGNYIGIRRLVRRVT